MVDNYTLEKVAKYCMMGTRNFSRHFKSANGISFNAWLINARLNYSLELLESSNLSISVISHKAGLSSEQVYRKHFIKKYDTSPKAWKKYLKA